MNLKALAEKIGAGNREDIGRLRDWFETLRLIEGEDYEYAHSGVREVRRDSLALVKKRGNSEALDLYKRTLLFDARDNFDIYLQYLEFDRKAQERFYLPRRRVLKQIVDRLQDLADDKLDELFVSMPPRVGKTSIIMFYCTWLIGRDSEKSNLYSAFSDIITSSFYNGVLEVLNDPNTYLWKDVFPEATIAGTNAKDETLNIDRRKRYPSLTCRSLYGTLNGACDCNGMLISDDLIGGIEEALNKDRMISAWSKVDNNLIPRAKESAKILWVGTRWSMIDPAGIRMDLLMNDAQFANRRFDIINLPALDEQEHSNFEYQYGVGFSSEYYKMRRASFERNNDMASWLAQYQQEPIERSGALFDPQDMRYYNGELPAEEPIRIFMAVDPAWGGGDYVAAPICYEYADGSCYVPAVVYNNGDKRITQPEVAQKIQEHHVQAVQFEANKTTQSYQEEVERILDGKGYKCHIYSRPAPTNQAKNMRIFDKAPDIRELIFLADGKRDKEYNLFMQNVYAFKVLSKNQHDDAPDSLAQVVDMRLGRVRNKVEVFRRPF